MKAVIISDVDRNHAEAVLRDYLQVHGVAAHSITTLEPERLVHRRESQDVGTNGRPAPNFEAEDMANHDNLYVIIFTHD